MNPPSRLPAPDAGTTGALPHRGCVTDRRVGCPPAPWLFGLLFLLLAPLPVDAQWVTQTHELKAGWNAVYLHVNPDHATVSDLAGLAGPIEEVWHFNPPSAKDSAVESPLAPVAEISPWTVWKRVSGPSKMKLRGNAAYLVRVAETQPNPYRWSVTGKPVIPDVRWTTSGLNLIGFPTPSGSPPDFARFLASAPEILASDANLSRYNGGDITNNPVPIPAFLAGATQVRRGEAYWVRSDAAHNGNIGPFEVVSSSPDGVDFGSNNGQARLRLRNLVTNELTVTLQQEASEADPGTGIVPPEPPLLLRGDLNTTNLTYRYTPITRAPLTWSLKGAGTVGSEVDVVLGLNRSAMTNAGTAYAGILRLTDSLGLSQVAIAVSASKESTAGLWVGGVEVTNVANEVTWYAQVTNLIAFTNLLTSLVDLGPGDVLSPRDGFRYQWDPATGRVLVFGGPDTNNPARGSYLVLSRATNDAAVASSFPLRLIIHDSGGEMTLLQQVYFGPHKDTTNAVLTLQEKLLHLKDARRISAVHLPLGTTERMTPQGGDRYQAVVTMGEDMQESNPFLHTYHPDHDNRDAQFAFIPASDKKSESYGVERTITLTFEAPKNDFASLTQGGQARHGTYREILTFKSGNTELKKFAVSGAFGLRRISEIPTLTR